MLSLNVMLTIARMAVWEHAEPNAVTMRIIKQKLINIIPDSNSETKLKVNEVALLRNKVLLQANGNNSRFPTQS